ncbi:MAG: ribosomal RNA small subunit methyltransferase A [Nitrospiraceae bacterium]|mgnify:CR=1 FL=1|jgi:16S rRNA (adenine1518-N6/adenine1519-N6)-dimethyltransferase|nr:ribosomal RNA small subunit methyltransferase A [Nitrospiraceae bacterium]|tara:strand:+ start:2534 stop:3394 length:861 start_codon:yes stop_codon:yes gene_type:complete
MRRPKKSLGQHFLVNRGVAEKILAVVGLPKGYTPPTSGQGDETFVEVGPGHGILTKPLAERAQHVIAIEIDASLVTTLKDRLSTYSNLEIIHANALSFDYESIPGKIVVVSNLPYNIATPLLFRFLALRTKVTRLTLMFQKELADRITASPGMKAYGQLSVAAQLFTEAKIGFTVPPTCFIPPPRVNSAVISLRVRSKPPIAVGNESHFLDIVRRAFAYRRKTLVGALCQGGLDKQEVMNALSKSQITSTRRAETLTIEEFASLAHAFTTIPIPIEPPPNRRGRLS